jgi:glucosamine 6-phosphate synthetase-like amidotransferase/phosphosugar isomerase protein
LIVVLQVQKGEVFVSQTDTEVIPKLCKWIYHSLPERVPFSEVGPIRCALRAE